MAPSNLADDGVDVEQRNALVLAAYDELQKTIVLLVTPGKIVYVFACGTYVNLYMVNYVKLYHTTCKKGFFRREAKFDMLICI